MNSNITSTELQYMYQIDLTNHYENDKQRKILCCKICKHEMPNSNVVFEHTVSKRHKYNKLLYAIMQGLSSNTDLDFIVQNIDTLQCRYCNVVIIINSEMNDLLITSHTEDAMHVRKKADWLSVESNSLKPLDSLLARLASKMRVKKRGRNIKLATKLPQQTNLITRKLEDTNNCGQNNSLQYSMLSINYATQRGEELPEYIICGEGGTCWCRTCHIQIPMTAYNVSGHIDGKKHKRNMDNWNKIMESCKESQQLIAENNTPQNIDEVHSQLDIPKCINVEKNGRYRCTICLTLVPRTPCDAQLHVNGKKHKRKQLESVQSIGQKSQDLGKLIPAPNSVIESSTYACTTCDMTTVNNGCCKQRHNDSVEHNRKIQQLRIARANAEYLRTDNSSGYIITLGNQHFCKICNKFLPEDHSLMGHVDTVLHQNRVQIATSFVVINATWVECKYCNVGLITNTYEYLIRHIQSTMHSQRQGYHLNKNNGYSKTLAIEHPTISVYGDSDDYFEFEKYWVICKYCRNNPIICKELAQKHIRDIMHLKMKEYCLRKAAEDDKALTIRQYGLRAQAPATKFGPILTSQRENNYTESRQRQLAVRSYNKVNEIQNEPVRHNPYDEHRTRVHQHNSHHHYYPNRHIDHSYRNNFGGQNSNDSFLLAICVLIIWIGYWYLYNFPFKR